MRGVGEIIERDVCTGPRELVARVSPCRPANRPCPSLIRTLAGECGHKLKLTKQGGGKVKAEWEKKSGLVTL